MAGLDPRFIKAFGVALQDTILANVGDAVTSFTGGFVNLHDWATSLRTDATNALTNAAGAQSTADTITQGITQGATGIPTSDATQVAPAISGIQDTTTSNASSIAALNASQNASSTGGAHYSENFNTDASPIANFTQYAAGAASIIASGGQAQLADGGSANGARFALYNSQTATSDQSVAVVVGTVHAALFFATTIAIRCNATMSEFVYLNVFGNKVYLGNSTLSGGSVTTNDWNPGGTSIPSLSSGSTVELQVTGNTYKVLVNGVVKLVKTDTTYGGTFNDGTHLGWGFGMSSNGASSFNIDSISASDISPVAVQGTGWKLYRSSSSASTSVTWSTAANPLAASTFDVQDTARTANVTVDSLGVGRIQIQKAGFYMASVHLRANLALALGGVALLGGTSTGAMAPIEIGQVGPDSDDNGTTVSYNGKTFGHAWPVYCPVGYYLQPACWKQQSGGTTSTGVIGDTAGTLTNFAGALLNPG
jgi:hypothetical protein